jgi:hypothetical protein
MANEKKSPPLKVIIKLNKKLNKSPAISPLGALAATAWLKVT